MPLPKELARELLIKYARWARSPARKLSSEEMRDLLSKAYKVPSEEIDKVIDEGVLGLRYEEMPRMKLRPPGTKEAAPLTEMKFPGKSKAEIDQEIVPQLTQLELKQTAEPKQDLPSQLVQVFRQKFKIKAPETEPEIISRIRDKQEGLVKNLPKSEAKNLIEQNPERYEALPSPTGVEGLKYKPIQNDLTKRLMELYGYEPVTKTPIQYERAVPVEKTVWSPLRKEMKAAGVEPEEFKLGWTDLWKSETEKSWWKEAMTHQKGGKSEEGVSPRAFFYKMMKMSEEDYDKMAADPVYKRFLNRINVLKKAAGVGGLTGAAAGISALYPNEEAQAQPTDLAGQLQQAFQGGAKPQTFEGLPPQLPEPFIPTEAQPETQPSGIGERIAASYQNFQDLMAKTKQDIETIPGAKSFFDALEPIAKKLDVLQEVPGADLMLMGGAGPKILKTIKEPGLFTGEVLPKLKSMYGNFSEEAWQGARKLWYMIPGMEKIWKTSLTKMEEGGMQRAADFFRDYRTRLGLANEDISTLSKYIYKGLTPNEEEFAAEAMRNPSTMWDSWWKGLANASNKWGVNASRAKEIFEDYVTPAREMFKEKGKEAVLRGLLKDATYVKNLETYLPRMYWTKEMMDALKESGFRPRGQKLRLGLERFMERQDIPEAVRQQMQEINQLSYVTFKGLRQITHDTETQRLFQKLAMNPEWVQTPTKAMKKMGVFPTKDWTLLPQNKTLGPLSGKLVRTPLAEEVNEITRIAGDFEKAWNTYLMTPWKFGKTVLRTSTHGRNILSNFMLNDFGGLSPTRLDIYAKALWQTIRGEGKEFYLGSKYGLLDANFASKELGLFGEKIGRKPLEPGVWDKIKQIADYPLKPIKGSLNFMGRVYQGEEQWFKLAKFMHNLEKGMPYREAANDAMKWTFNYGEITPAIRMARTYAMPFATFTYKALPIVAETAIKHPLRLAKYPLAAIAATGYALDKMNVTEDDWKRLKQILPDYLKRGHFMLLPTRDKQGRFQLLDLTYVYPWGDIGEMAQQGIGRFFQNPAFQLIEDYSKNQGFSGQKIWYDWEQPTEKAYKILRHAWTQLMPSYVPGGVDWDTIYKALAGVTQEKEALNLSQSLLQAFAGAKIRPIDIPTRAQAAAGRISMQKMEIGSEFKRALKEHPERAEQIRKEYREHIKSLYTPSGSTLGKIVGSPLEWANP